MLKFRLTRLMIFSVFLYSCSAGGDRSITPSYPAKYLEELTIAQLEKGYAEGKWTVKKIVSDYISRIEALDRSGPMLNSVIIINPDALKIADSLDNAIASGKNKGSLFGVPVLLKDNIDTHDKMPNTAGSRALAKNFPSNDSPVARKLREAGAVILGKTNLSEWANFRSSSSSSGWSGVGRQTKNPYVLDRNPCGSSSGSGAAVSANLCMMAIGTETDGSIVCPSNNNGIVGLKPTVGLISRAGIIPISFNQDTPGPMGRTVSDIAAALGCLTGVDSADARTLASAGNFLKDYTSSLQPDGLKGKRLGLIKNEMGYSAKVDSLIMNAIYTMRKAGAEIVIIDCPKANIGEDSYNVLLYEFREGINKYLASLPAILKIKNLKDLIEFNRKDSIELDYFDQKIFEQAYLKGDLKSKEYINALKKIRKATQEDGIDKYIRDYKLDCLLEPTGSPAWKTDLLLGDHFVGGSSSLAAIAGYPSLTVPAGFVNSLPVGISFTGKAWSEPLLIRIAYSFEQATKNRKAPEFKPTD